MKYAAFVGTEGAMPAEAVEEMNRGFAAYRREIEPRGVKLLGRELDLPDTAVTVRVRDGEALVTDGPFAETKEFVGGLDVLSCSDLDEAIEVEGKSPVARFLPFEIRPFRGEPRLGPRLPAFARGEDRDEVPYLLIVWAAGDDSVPLEEYDAWRAAQETDGCFVLGGALAGPEAATTLRFRDGDIRVSDGPFLDLAEHVAGIEVVSCRDRSRAAEIAAGHPAARVHAIEVRPFYTEAAGGPEPGA